MSKSIECSRQQQIAIVHKLSSYYMEQYALLLLIARIYLLIMNLTVEISQQENNNQFESDQQTQSIQLISKPQIGQYYHSLQNDENQEEIIISKENILQGNPILPPGKHHIRQQPQFRLKFLSNREKFNKTSFTNTSKLGKSLLNTNQQCNTSKDKRDAKQRQMDGEDQYYLKLLKTRKQVYRRINNSKINFIGKDRVLCSIFFDWRKESFNAKNESIFESIANIKKLKCSQPAQDWLKFSSMFQSGNLMISLRSSSVSLPTYELYMQNDVNTKGCTQWYYFSVVNSIRGKAKLRIMNFYKPTSLYQKGMKILCSYDGIQWKRTGTSVTYSKIEQNNQGWFSLDFLHDFDIVDKKTYFAYGYPYTYTFHLNNYLTSLYSQPKFQRIINRTTLCLSAMGNPIHMIYISNFSQKKQPRQLIYIIGRQHPGETPASYIMEGLINFLLSNTQQAKQLRQKYEFRVIPMVNVDGVISGNYRSNISGTDINRQWQFPSKKGHPQVYWLKQQIYNNKKQVAFFLDIHAHSRKMNSFFYGSKTVNNDTKLYPFVCSKLNKFISFSQSAFSNDPSKRTTARVILQTQLSIQNSLTFEVSFYGWVDPIKQTNYSFKQSDLKNIGESLGIGFYYSLIGIEGAKNDNKANLLPKCQNEKEKTLAKNSFRILQKWNKQLERQVNENMQQVFSEGSSLDPEHFQLKQQQKQFIAQMARKQIEEKKKERNLSTPKNSKISSRKLFNYLTIDASQVQDSKLLSPKGENLNDKSLGISGNQFYLFSQSSKGSKKHPFSVKQLQLQLQLSGQTSYRSKGLRGIRMKMGQNKSNLDRYESLDVDSHKNYRNDVLEMKKALKYLLQSKSSDYDHYKSCFKAFNNELISGMERYQEKKK